MKFNRGFTILELVIVMLLVTLLGFFAFAIILKARKEARKSACSYKLRRIIRGVNRYEVQNGSYPPGRLQPDWIDFGFLRPPYGYSNYGSVYPGENSQTGFYSVHTWILPFIGRQAVFDMIDFDRAQGQKMLNVFGTSDGMHISFDAYTKPMSLFLCPSDINYGSRRTDNNYRYNFGGSSPGAGLGSGNYDGSPSPDDLWPVGGNGAFSIGEEGLRRSAFTDGLSYTAFFSERTKGTGELLESIPSASSMIRCLPPAGFNPAVDNIEMILQTQESFEPTLLSFVFNSAGRWVEGSDWSNGWPFGFYSTTQYNHVAPPNWKAIDCGVSYIPNTPTEHAIISARSRHPNCVNVAYGDGHVRKISNDIDLQVWRAMGTRDAADEVVFEKERKKRNRWRW